MKRITVSLDVKLMNLLKNKQADLILEKNKSVSISGVIGLMLDTSFKSDKTINSELDSIFSRPNY